MPNNTAPKKILIVEDELIISKVYSLYLIKQGYTVTACVTNAEDALKFYSENLPDLVVLDVRLKNDGNGIEVAKQLRKLGNTPIIFTTGNSAMIMDELNKEISNTSTLIKPVPVENLLSEIKKILK
ncbi:MAG: response regulator [Bacteroidota bacterium]